MCAKYAVRVDSGNYILLHTKECSLFGCRQFTIFMFASKAINATTLSLYLHSPALRSIKNLLQKPFHSREADDEEEAAKVRQNRNAMHTAHFILHQRDVDEFCNLLLTSENA